MIFKGQSCKSPSALALTLVKCFIHINVKSGQAITELTALINDIIEHSPAPETFRKWESSLELSVIEPFKNVPLPSVDAPTTNPMKTIFAMMQTDDVTITEALIGLNFARYYIAEGSTSADSSILDKEPKQRALFLGHKIH